MCAYFSEKRQTSSIVFSCACFDLKVWELMRSEPRLRHVHGRLFFAADPPRQCAPAPAREVSLRLDQALAKAAPKARFGQFCPDQDVEAATGGRNG